MYKQLNNVQARFYAVKKLNHKRNLAYKSVQKVLNLYKTVIDNKELPEEALKQLESIRKSALAVSFLCKPF